MGAVYAAFDEKLERDVALKVLVEEAEAPQQKRRLLREARLAAKLQHPNIATVYEVDELDGRLYIVMELLDGTSLRKLLNKRKLSIDEAVSIARDIARALARAHGAGVVHRDIKPENVFITTPSPDVILAKVLDFGLARQNVQAELQSTQEQSSTDTTTTHGDIWGTPGYVSPEQVRGQRVDARTDIFSFGVVFYEMLTNIRPFRAENAVAMMLATMKHEPRPVREILPELPLAIDELVRRCLEKSAEKRYADGAELNVAIDSCLRGSMASGRLLNAVGSRPSLPLLTFEAPTADPVALREEVPTIGAATIATLKEAEQPVAPPEPPAQDRMKLLAAVGSGLGVALIVVVLSLSWATRRRAEGMAAARTSSASVAAPSVSAPVTVVSQAPPELTPAIEIDPEEREGEQPRGPLPAPTETTTTVQAPPVPTAGAGTRKKRPADDCAQPFVVDSKGVRIPKLHCLK
jgi:hypothetical protein